MDIFNRIPAISEDTLHYTFYPPQESSDHTSTTALAASIDAFTQNLLPSDFLWHRDAFEVKVVADPDHESHWVIEGRMRVGDCVDDEWCTVWLLKEISSKWDIAISVSDSDGEFLLIEAADALPRWVKPTNSVNRVWIYNSHLHLIDVSHVSPPSRNPPRQKLPNRTFNDDEDDQMQEELEDFLAVEDALKLLRDPLTDTLAPRKVEEIIWSRISEYPAATRQHLHLTKAYIPSDIAKALSVDPSLIQKAAEAFYTRDGIQLRSAHRMTRFPPHTSILATEKITRTAYAQLVGQKFYPPKIFGRWEEKEGTKEWRWRDIGMKMAVGFEILYQEDKSHGVNNTSAEGIASSAEARKDALRRNPDYNTYIQNLESTNYFKGEIRNSQLWKELEDRAAEVFVNSRQENSVRPSFATLVTSAISRAPNDNNFSAMDEDSDDWLNIDANSFEDMLQHTSGNDDKTRDPDSMEVDETPEDQAASKQASQLRDLASKVEEFIEGEGDVEGARFADELLSDEELDDDDDDDGEESDSDHQMNTEERQAAMDKLVPNLDPSDYGKMPPSYHGNSQRVAPGEAVSEADPDDKNARPQTSNQGNKPIRRPILPRDDFDGVDSDDETDEEADADSESEEDKPQVVGDIEIDMGEEEDEFLEFSRQALGISDSQWDEILKDRKSRGAFVPNTVSMTKKSEPAAVDKMDQDPASGSSPTANPNLDSFEAVMKAMDEELHRSRPASSTKNGSVSGGLQNKGKGKEKDKGKGKATVSFADEVDEDEDIEAAMEAELKAALEQGDDADDDGLGNANIDYNLIKNFLESFKSQAGLSGPVSNLAGMLQPGWTLPRDG